MIDMPDHVAGERGNRAAWRLPLIVLLGIALSVVAGMVSYGYTTAQAEQRFAALLTMWRRRAFPTTRSTAPMRQRT